MSTGIVVGRGQDFLERLEAEHRPELAVHARALERKHDALEQAAEALEPFAEELRPAFEYEDLRVELADATDELARVMAECARRPGVWRRLLELLDGDDVDAS